MHYYFEVDATDVHSGEQAEARDTVRSRIYRELYNIEYRYAAKKNRSYTASGIDDFPPPEDDIPTPLDPKEMSREVKPYIPPTSIDSSSHLPFGQSIDAPLN